MAKADWGAIEREYVTSPEGISYRELAEKYGVHKATVGTYGTRGNWPAKRDAHRRRMADKTLTKAEEKLAEEAAEEVVDKWRAAEKAARAALDAIDNPELPFNSKDAAIRALLEALKFLEVLGGNPDSITQRDVTHHGDLTLDEIEDAQEDLFVLALARRRSERTQGDGAGGSSD